MVREKDVLCGKGVRLCIPYLDRMLEFKNMYLSAKNVVKDKKEVVSFIYMTLKQEEFRFLELTGEGGRWKEKNHKSGKSYVYKRMIRMYKEKEGDIMTLTMEGLEAAPGPFESESLPGNGIVHLQQHEQKKHRPNAVFHRAIRTRATTERFERSSTMKEKNEIA